jgi:hypothetical protein
MEINTAQKATKILEEITGLTKFKNIIGDKDVPNAHFGVVQDYGNNPNICHFNSEHNPMFVALIESRINELKAELLAL